MSNKRYFFVVYSFWTANENGIGNMVVSNTVYPPLKSLISDAEKGVSRDYKTNSSKCAITNIIELSEEDFETFNV